MYIGVVTISIASIHSDQVATMCGSRKYPYSPHRRDWKFQGGGGVLKSQKFKAMYEAKLEFPEGWGVHRPNPFRGGIWIFSGTTQCTSTIKYNSYWLFC